MMNAIALLSAMSFAFAANAQVTKPTPKAPLVSKVTAPSDSKHCFGDYVLRCFEIKDGELVQSFRGQVIQTTAVTADEQAAVKKQIADYRAWKQSKHSKAEDTKRTREFLNFLENPKAKPAKK